MEKCTNDVNDIIANISQYKPKLIFIDEVFLKEMQKTNIYYEILPDYLLDLMVLRFAQNNCDSKIKGLFRNITNASMINDISESIVKKIKKEFIKYNLWNIVSTENPLMTLFNWSNSIEKYYFWMKICDYMLVNSNSTSIDNNNILRLFCKHHSDVFICVDNKKSYKQYLTNLKKIVQ